jgi:hypothetical protein
MPTKRFSARQLSWIIQSRPAISIKTDSAKSRELITKARAAAPAARRWLRIAPDGKSLPCRLYRGDISLPGECGANHQDSGQPGAHYFHSSWNNKPRIAKSQIPESPAFCTVAGNIIHWITNIEKLGNQLMSG